MPARSWTGHRITALTASKVERLYRPRKDGYPRLVCGTTVGVETTHTGPHGIGQKSPDTSAIPLCSRHHRTGRDSYHKLGPRTFQRCHGIDIRTVVVRLTAKPSIRIEGGVFIGRYLDEEYVLGPVQAGLSAAVRKILLAKREDRTWRSLESAQPDFQEFFRIRNRLQHASTPYT
jgi:hypothetical protein